MNKCALLLILTLGCGGGSNAVRQESLTATDLAPEQAKPKPKRTEDCQSCIQRVIDRYLDQQ
jgi:hypothetical protein